jgi:hypothetical protein
MASITIRSLSWHRRPNSRSRLNTVDDASLLLLLPGHDGGFGAIVAEGEVRAAGEACCAFGGCAED